MTLRIRFPQGRVVKRHREQNLIAASASLLTPMCVMAYVLAFWRLAADIGLAKDSASQSFFSHWQLWIAIAVGLHFAARKWGAKLDSTELGH